LVDVPGGVVQSEQKFVLRINAGKFGASRNDIYEALRVENTMLRENFHPIISVTIAIGPRQQHVQGIFQKRQRQLMKFFAYHFTVD